MGKYIFSLIFEIILCSIIIFITYILWDNFDQTNYNIAKYYDNTKEVDLIYESNIDNGYSGNNVVLSLHNISDKNNDKDIIFKINKDTYIEYLKVNEVDYYLCDKLINEDKTYKYYLIDNVKLEGYETKIYYVNLITNNNIYDYQFVTEL